jgi:asparagine synthase (glutamine-hydrolysing)
MCGITGIISVRDTGNREKELAVMMSTIKHRGPDDEGTFMEDGVSLGFLRLSILDLSKAGHQPMFSADKRYVLVFNGEIFNYIELRKELAGKGHQFRTQTDTEVLLAAYMEWGMDMLHRLNGMWAFAIYDRLEKTLFCSRDRHGVKPFYYCVDGGRILFASETPAILAALGRKPTPDRQVLFNFLLFNRTDQTNRTFFTEIKRLDHGHFFKIKTDRPDQVEPQKWYDLRKELKEPFKNPQEFREMFSSSVGLRLRSDVPVGVCLSGGLDSSSIVSVLLNDYGKKGLHTFSAIYGKGNFGDESEFINLYNSTLKNQHFIQPDEHSLMADIEAFVFAHCEPVPSTSPYAQFKVMELAKQHVTVTLDGQGADEELAGYHYFFGFYFKDLFLRGKFGKLATEMTHYLTKHRDLMGLKSLLFFMLPASMRKRVKAFEKGYLATDFYETYASQTNTIAGDLYGSSSLQDALLNHFKYKLEHLLKWEDSNSMWFSIESRVPFLDYRLVERTLSLPDELIINKGMTKHILREAMKGTLPEKIRMRRDKVGFGTPQDEWFRTPLFQNYILELIHSDSFASRNLLNIDDVKSIYRKHLNRQGNYANEIWKWIHLENWFRHFVDDSGKGARGVRDAIIVRRAKEESVERMNGMRQAK